MTRLASDIREAQKPIFCSACFNSQDVRHIDFDAASDRGYGKTEAIEVAMDDLILCENCVKNGAELLGMTDDAALKARVTQLERVNDLLEKRVVKSERYASTMEDLLGQKEINVDHRKKPRATPDLSAA
jgi:hypothetical protein